MNLSSGGVSYDLAIWLPNQILSDEQALKQYHDLCDDNISGLIAHPSINTFCLELSSIHPEIDDVPEAKPGDFDFSLWSVAHDGKK